MNIFAWILAAFLGTVATAQAQEDVKSQEYYDEQVTESLQRMTSELQTVTSEVIKYMNAINKALNESMPQLSDNMGKLISSMKPIAETMQQNVDDFAQAVQQQIDESPTFSAPEDVVVPDVEDIYADIDAELAQFDDFPPANEPTKIKLFPSSVE